MASNDTRATSGDLLPSALGVAISPASTGVNWLQVAMRALFLLLALKQWRGRPQPGEQPELPKWMAAIDTFTPGKLLGQGLGALGS